MTSRNDYERRAAPNDALLVDNLEFEPDSDGGYSSKRTVPLDRARTFVAEHAALEASWAPDHEDRTRAWVYVTELT